MTIHTAFGDGEIVEVDRGRMGKTRYKVAGFGFEVWLDEADPAIHMAGNPRDRAGDSYAESRDKGDREHMRQDLADDDPYGYHDTMLDHVKHQPGGMYDTAIDPGYSGDGEIYTTQSPSYHRSEIDDFSGPYHTGASFDFEPTDHDWDNHTTLPYDWTPQFPVDMFRHEQTQSPDHEIDRDERTSPSDSRSGESRSPIHDYPGPSPKLFARRQAWTLNDDEDPNHVHEPDRWEQYNHHALDNAHVAAGWQPPLNPEHDPDFDEYEEDAFRPGFEPDYDQQGQDWARYQQQEQHNRDWQDAYHNQPWGPDHPDYDGVELPPEHRAQPGQPSAQDHVNADAARLQQELAADTSNPAHPDHLPPPRQGAWERPAGLSDKYAQILESADHHNDPVQRFRDDPHTAIQRHGSIDVSAGLDDGVGDEQLIYGSNDQILRTAAWRDVRKKASRLVREGRVDVHAMDSNAIYANVEGDHGVYEVMILNGSAYPNGGFNGGKRAIANWKCSCDWGKWAFKRQMTFVGRLCSHGYATYLTQQSHHLKNNPHHFRPKKKIAGVDEFKAWAKDENGGHIDMDAADTFLATKDEPASPEEAQKVYDYVTDHVSEHPERDYEQKGYSNDPDDAYKDEGVHLAADDKALRHQPGKLNPHSYEVPNEHYHEFEDLGDDRKTTGPDQIQAKVAKGDEDVRPHHPAFAWHVDDQPDFPKDGIVHFSSLTHLADENLLQRLRDLSEEGPAEHPHHAEEHNHEVSQVVDELHDRGYAAAPLVAMKRAAMWKVADDTLPGERDQDKGFSGASFGDTLDDLFGGGGSPPPSSGPGGHGNPLQEGGLNPDIPKPTATNDPTGGMLNQVLGLPPAGKPTTVSDVKPGGGGGAPAPGGGTPAAGAPVARPTGTPAQTGAGGNTFQDIVKSNPGNIGNSGTNIQNNPNLIHPGDPLNLPGGGTYTVQQGDTLSGIAQAHPGGGPGKNNFWTGQPNSAAGGAGGADAAKSTSPAPGGGSSGSGMAAKGLSALPGAGSPGGVSGGGSTPGGNISKGMMPGGKIGVQQFARLYFQAADEGGSGGSDDSGSGEKEKVPSNSSTSANPGTGNAGSQYKPVANPATPVNQPRPDSSNPLGAPAAGSVSVSGPKGTDSTASPAPGQQQPKQQQPGGMAGGIGPGLSQALSVAEPLIQGVGGALGSLPGIGPAISGVTNALGGLGNMFTGSNDAARFAARYFQAEGDFLGEGGADWMDHSFAGSGPNIQQYSQTSESYVNEHERPKRQETWMTDNDGDVVKYTDRPKQFKSRRRVADGGMLGGGDAGYGSTGGMAGGTLSPSGSGQGLGGSFTEADSSSGAPTMGTLTNTANVSESARQFWADAFHPSEQGFFNPHLRPYQDYDKGEPDTDKPKGKGKGDATGDAADATGVANEAAGIVEDAAPALLAASTNDRSDVVRRFQASGGGCLGGGGFDDNSIAHQAQRMLRTAGRKFTPAEERELEMEAHVLGARNLGDLDLRGTHYLDD